MNLWIGIGRLAADPELRYTPQNTAVAHITLAVDRIAKQGEEKKADFIRITVFGKQAETVNKYLSKGRQVAVTGRIETGSYKDKDGKTVYTTDILAERVEFLGSSKQDGNGYKSSQRSNMGPPAYNQNEEYDPYEQMGFQAIDDDIMF